MPREATPLDEDELDTILAVARNRQSGRITEFEIKELVRVYREWLKNQGTGDGYTLPL
jgi:hypothetical protein